jgi:hypothetical protein
MLGLFVYFLHDPWRVIPGSCFRPETRINNVRLKETTMHDRLGVKNPIGGNDFLITSFDFH